LGDPLVPRSSKFLFFRVLYFSKSACLDSFPSGRKDN
jgi:hypothetical protein